LRQVYYAVMVALTGAALLAVTGCSSLGGASHDSFARQVASAGGVNVRDVPASRLRGHQGGGQEDVTAALMAAGTAKGYLTPPPGISVGLATGILGAGALVSLMAKDPSDFHRVFAWMPKSEAATPADANRRLKELLVAAVSAAYPDYRVADVSRKPAGLTVDLTGPQCAPCKFGVGEIVDPKEVVAPAFAGGHESYTWPNSDWKRRAFWWNPAGEKSVRVEGITRSLDFYQRVSAQLPAWVFLYIAPTQGVTSMPVILNQGRAHLFVRMEQ
jgi:hypothetical protein